MTKYKIGKVSKEFDVTFDALRFYEKNKILKPQKDKNSGYRYYSFDDLGTFLTIKAFRQMGFSINDIVNLFEGLDEKETIEFCKYKLHEKRIEIERLQSEMQRLTTHLDDLEKYHYSESDWYIQTLEPFYFVRHYEMYHGEICDKDNNIFIQWIKHLPTVYSSLYIPKEKAFNNDLKNCYWGMTITESKMKEMNLPINNSVSVLPMGKAFCYHYRKNSEDKISLSILSKPFEILAKIGYELNGDILCRYISGYKKEDKNIENYIVTIPIKEISKKS